MRKNLFPAFLLLSIISRAQPSVSGLWQGKLSVGVDLNLVFHFSQNGNKQWTVAIDCPEQGIKDMKATTVSIEADSVKVEVSQLHGWYKAKLLNDSVMTGSWIQGAAFPLSLKKTDKIAALIRPQTPFPPFPYQSQDIIYFNKDKSIQYGATISFPKGKGPFPAALLITGSGQQNRDEEIPGHKPFAVIADYLTRQGYVVLRVDDRGMGQTTGDVPGATSKDFENDALVSLDYLKKRKEVDPKKIGLIGHSEGGMIAEMIAAERKDIAFVILLAGPGEPLYKLMSDQNEATLKAVGLPAGYVQQYLTLYKALLPAIANSESKGKAEEAAAKLVKDWMAKTPKAVVLYTTGIKDEASETAFVNAFVEQVGSPWFRYFLKYDPAPYLKKISASVLALNGEKDIQVVSASNLAGIKASLEKSKSKKFEVKELKGLNHLFQHCTRCTIQEYGQLEETFAPEALETIRDWLKKNIQ
jgi:pimeloyl-ACP methyl ester carboxylesterase